MCRECWGFARSRKQQPLSGLQFLFRALAHNMSVSRPNKYYKSENGEKRSRKGAFSSCSMLKTSAKDLKFTTEVLADIGVCPLDEDSNSSDDQNEMPSDVSFKSLLAPSDLGPTPQDNIIRYSTPPRVLQPHDTNTPVLPINFNLRKRQRSEMTTGRDLFREVSDEIVLEIFRWLPKSTLKNCAVVSKRWHRLSYDDSLWKFLDLGGRKLNEHTLGHVLRRGVVVMRLAKADITAPIFPSSSNLLKQYKFCKVQLLDLSMANISVSGLEELFSFCNKLQKLSLENCEVNNKICKYLEANQNLNELNLALCRGIEKKGLVAILNGCQKLEALNLAWTELSKETIDFAVCNFPNSLKRLNLSGCRHTLDNDNLEDIVDQCRGLIELDISDAILLTHHSVKYIAEYLTELESLSLSRCTNINPDVYWVLNMMPTLTNLEVFGLFNQAGLDLLRTRLTTIRVNENLFSTIARPTTGIRRTSIWTHRVRE